MTLSLVERIVGLHDSFRGRDVPHAFGGALALAFATAEPRATADIDCNVFLDASAAARAFDALPAGITWGASDLDTVHADGQVRLFWDRTPVDLFFDVHDFHHFARDTVITVPFAGSSIPVLSATALAVCKALFDRPKDWVDLQGIVDSGLLDRVAAGGWLLQIVGPTDPRLTRFAALAAPPAAG